VKPVELSGGHGTAAVAVLLAAFALSLSAAPARAAQQDRAPGPSADGTQATSSDSTLVLVRGTSHVVEHGARLERVSIADTDVADAVVVSADEVVVNAKSPGQTTLLLWDEQGGRRMFGVDVTVDAGAVQEQIDRVIPEAEIDASASGNTIILTGTVRDPGMEERALSLARTLAGEAGVLNQMSVPDRGQVMLKVRFAEVNRSALDEFGFQAYAVDDENVSSGIGSGRIFTPSDGDDELVETSQDAVNFFLFHRPSRVQAFLSGLETRGLLRSLAEPNLMAVPGDTASFLAGGEFPFPVLQGGAGGGGSNAVTIQFKEFGIRLNFVPTITNSGAIRIRAAPEVSQLDFSQGLEVSGFNVPALLSRRAETVIELSPGQTFAIAGLVDNTLNKSVNKVPFLGDIPILGELFRSEEMRQERSELLVLVTPHIVRPTDGPPPELPTGEPETWDWVDELIFPEEGDADLLDGAGDDGGEDGASGGRVDDRQERRAPRRSMIPDRAGDPDGGGTP
jgi:pilus assembly protein CpaC